MRAPIAKSIPCLRIFSWFFRSSHSNSISRIYTNCIHNSKGMRSAEGGGFTGHGVHRLAPFGMLSIIEEQIPGGSRRRGQGPKPLRCLLRSRGFGVPTLHHEEGVEPAPVVPGLQIAGYIGHMMPPSGEGHHQDQPANILQMVPPQVALQGTKERVERAGHAYDAKHEAILPTPMVNGRLHLFTIVERPSVMSYPQWSSIIDGGVAKTAGDLIQGVTQRDTPIAGDFP